MSGRHDLRELTDSFTPERRKRVEARKAELRAAMPLHELRHARAMTRRALCEALHVNQPAVAKLERRTDMYVSNLRAYIEAMGGRLNIIAEFPRGHVSITNFSDVDEGSDAVTPIVTCRPCAWRNHPAFALRQPLHSPYRVSSCPSMTKPAGASVSTPRRHPVTSHSALQIRHRKW